MFLLSAWWSVGEDGFNEAEFGPLSPSSALFSGFGRYAGAAFLSNQLSRRILPEPARTIALAARSLIAVWPPGSITCRRSDETPSRTFIACLRSAASTARRHGPRAAGGVPTQADSTPHHLPNQRP